MRAGTLRKLAKHAKMTAASIAEDVVSLMRPCVCRLGLALLGMSVDIADDVVIISDHEFA